MKSLQRAPGNQFPILQPAGLDFTAAFGDFVWKETSILNAVSALWIRQTFLILEYLLVNECLFFRSILFPTVVVKNRLTKNDFWEKWNYSLQKSGELFGLCREVLNFQSDLRWTVETSIRKIKQVNLQRQKIKINMKNFYTLYQYVTVRNQRFRLFAGTKLYIQSVELPLLQKSFSASSILSVCLAEQVNTYGKHQQKNKIVE